MPENMGFVIKMRDGSLAEPRYVSAVSKLVTSAAAATELLGDDALEEYAASTRQ